MSEPQITLAEQFGQLCVDFIKTPAGQAILQERAEKVFREALDRATGYDSAFRKGIETALTRTLACDVDKLDLTSYNDMLLQFIERQVQHFYQNAINDQLRARVTELLEPPPKEIKLTELVKQYVEELRDGLVDDCTCGDDTVACCIIAAKDGGFQYIGLDETQKDKRRYHDCQIQIGVHRDQVFSLRFRNIEVERRMFSDTLYNFELSLFRMKAAQTRLIVDVTDPDELELNYGPPEHD